MGIGNTSLALDLLNGAGTWVADVADGAALGLVVGGVYNFCPVGADITWGFGATSAAAITDGNSSHGEPFADGAPTRVVEIQSAAVRFVGCAGGTLRVRRCADPT